MVRSNNAVVFEERRTVGLIWLMEGFAHQEKFEHYIRGAYLFEAVLDKFVFYQGLQLLLIADQLREVIVNLTTHNFIGSVQEIFGQNLIESTVPKIVHDFSIGLRERAWRCVASYSMESFFLGFFDHYF